jgi:AcrR family transcriptional regulator
MGNKANTMEAIADEAHRLIEESGGELPTAREISKATGYSAGTVYLHFGAIGGVIRYLVKSRMMSLHNGVDAIINAHDPKTHPGLLLDQIVDHMFTGLSRFNPNIMRKMYQIAVDHEDRPLEFEQAGDPLIVRLHLAAARDETGIFKELTLEEINLVHRGLRGIVLFPLLERNRIFCSPAHRELAKTYLRKMLLKEE